MKRVWKVLRWLAVIGFGVFVMAQFIRPAKTNPTADPSLAIESHVQVDPNVSAIFDRSCADCHSNKTRWPWYSHVAPVSWFVIDHVNEGRKELNLSEWGQYDRRRQLNKLRQICREVTNGAMPLGSYTPMHAGSSLTPNDVKTLCDWTDATRKVIETGT
jgi:heme-binding protein